MHISVRTLLPLANHVRAVLASRHADLEGGGGRDLDQTPEEQYGLLVSHEVSPQELITPAPNTPALQDDRPINEYYWLRMNQPRLAKTLQ